MLTITTSLECRLTKSFSLNSQIVSCHAKKYKIFYIRIISYCKTMVWLIFTAAKELVVMFSCRLKKCYNFSIKKERNFVISNINIYNFK